MRILYIALDNPAVDAIIGGMHDEELSGLPAFYYPFKMFLERGHTIDLLLYSEDRKTVIESEHFKRENLILVRPTKKGLAASLELPFLMTMATRRQLKAREYDFVYGMSEGAEMSIREASRQGIPCALRQYGVQEMTAVLEKIPNKQRRYLKALKDYTYITLSLNSKKNFLLATNDGSRADELFDLLGIKKKKYNYYFWRSGVRIPQEQPTIDEYAEKKYPETYDSMTLSAVARIADVKRQDRCVRILGELHRRGYPMHLYLIGETSSQKMYNDTVTAAKECGVEAFVHFEGSKSQTVWKQYARNSFATLLTAEWNRLNIFYEVMGEGSVVLTNDNHSIDEFILDGVNCLVYEEDNYVQAAEKLIALMNAPEKIKAIRAAAHQTAKEKFMSMEKRFGLEVQLVEDTAMGRDVSQYPMAL